MNGHNLLANGETKPQTGTSSAIRGPIVRLGHFALYVFGNLCVAVSNCELESSVSQLFIKVTDPPWHRG